MGRGDNQREITGAISSLESWPEVWPPGRSPAPPQPSGAGGSSDGSSDGRLGGRSDGSSDGRSLLVGPLLLGLYCAGILLGQLAMAKGMATTRAGVGG